MWKCVRSTLFTYFFTVCGINLVITCDNGLSALMSINEQDQTFSVKTMSDNGGKQKSFVS